MRIAFVSIPRFACAVEVQREPHLGRLHLMVGDADQPKRVLDCSLSATGLGVEPGMTLRKALSLCPDAVIKPPDPVLYGLKWESVLEALGEISPEIEPGALGQAYVNVRGLGTHYEDDEVLVSHIAGAVRLASGLEAAVGLADGKFPAFVAAASPAGWGRVVPAGGEGDFLAPLPIDLLPFEPEVILRLRRFGLETMGEVARLSLPELQSQFGFDGKRLWQLVNGRDESPLAPRPAVEKIEANLSFEAPVAGIDVIVAAARQLLSRLRLALRGRAAREMTLQAELDSGRGWQRRLVLREAVSDSERLAFVMRSALQNAPPPNAVRSISLRLGGLTGETGKQLSLGERGRQQRQLEETVRQLKVRYGYSPVYNCLDVEPWSVIPEQRQVLIESDA